MEDNDFYYYFVKESNERPRQLSYGRITCLTKAKEVKKKGTYKHRKQTGPSS